MKHIINECVQKNSFIIENRCRILPRHAAIPGIGGDVTTTGYFTTKSMLCRSLSSDEVP